MPQEFEPQTEQETRSPASKIADPSAITPGASLISDPYKAAEMPLSAKSVVDSAQGRTLVPAVDANWQNLLQEWKHAGHQPWLRPISFLSLGMLGISVPVLWLTLSAFSPDPTLATLLLTGWLALWGILFLSGVTLPESSLTAKQTAIVSELGNVEDPQAVGPLLQAWDTATNVQGRTELGKILVRLLPRLRKEDGASLTPQQRRILYDTIRYTNTPRQPEIALACLEAIEHIGDHHALPPLARLIIQDAPSQHAQRVRERARHCLAHLTQNLDFGTKADIPGWIAKLPYQSSANSNMPTVPTSTEDALIALFALIQLLPQLQPSDASLVKASQHEYLAEAWRWIGFALTPPMGNGNVQQSRLGSDFSYAVLGALEQIGTGRDLSLSHWLLRDVPVDDLPQLRLKEHQVNAILKKRREKEQVGQTLLRGASAPSAAPGELLRPATAAQAASDPKELLRPEEERRYER